MLAFRISVTSLTIGLLFGCGGGNAADSPKTAQSLLDNFVELSCTDCNKNNPAWNPMPWDPAHGLAVGSTAGATTKIAVGRVSKNGGPIAIPPALVIYNNGSLTMSPAQLPNTGIIEANGNHANKILIADFDGNGTEDVFSANAGYDRNPFPGQLNTLYTENNGTWTTVSISGQKATFNHSAAIIDLNRDGTKDILVGLGTLSINRNDFNNYGILLNNQQFSASTQFVNLQVNMHVVATGDVNGDGQADIVYGGYEQGGTAYTGSGVLTRKADGTFEQTVFPRPGGQLVQAAGVPAIGDINGDGQADIVMLYTPAWPSTDRYRKPVIQVLLQGENNQWIDATESALIPANFDWSDSYNTKAYLADINSDGQKDLILEVSEKQWQNRRAWLRVFENQNGVLTEKELFLGQDQTRIDVVDIDNNGKSDIVLSRQSGLKIMKQR